MSSSQEVGLNRTGMATSPVDSRLLVEGAVAGGASHGTPRDLNVARMAFAREAEPTGHMPPPATFMGAAKSLLKALEGEQANVFLDKLAERLAFERTGVRLYDLVLEKAEVYPSWEGGPTRDDLRSIQQDELAHLGLLTQCLTKLGADPTAMTPSANLAKNLSQGIPAVLADPRTSLRECLEGLLVAELTDNASWELLISLAREMGQAEMRGRFEQALAAEATHLARVQQWLRLGTRHALSTTLAAPRAGAETARPV